ncbi:hypothetical protein V6N13_109143 [Hibiscus sabdariffa]
MWCLLLSSIHDVMIKTVGLPPSINLFMGCSGNKPAHALASEGLRQSGDRFWIEDAPALILALAAQDRCFLDPP